MIILKTTIVILALFISAPALFAEGAQEGPGSDSTEVTTIKLANFYASSHPVNVALRETFVPMVDAMSEGRYVVEVYDSSILGAEREFTEGIRLGTIEMGVVGGLLSESYPVLKVLELPFLFDDYDHVWRVLDGPLGGRFEEAFEDAGLNVLSWIGNGFRVFSNGVRPIETPADTEGIKMRMPENEMYIQAARALGFNVVTMSFSEVFTALSTRVVDGQDNPLATLVASSFYEVQEYVTLSNHMFSYGLIVMNLDLWNAMSDSDRMIFQEAADAAAVQQRELLATTTNDYVDTLIDAGLQVTYPDLEAFRTATAIMRDEFAVNYDWAPALIEAIRAEAD